MWFTSVINPSSTVCVSIPIQGWHLSTETWSIRVRSLQDGIRPHADCRTWPLGTGKPMGKIFSTTSFSKKIFYLSSLLSLFKYSLLVRPYPLSPFDHTKIQLMRPFQEVQDIGQLRPLRNEEYFSCIWIMETTTVEDRRQVEFEGSEECPDLYDLGRHPLWNLVD